MLISGLRYIPQYVSDLEQIALLTQLDAQSWLTDLQRRVQHYGYRYDYKRRSIDPTMHLGALPSWLGSLAIRMQSEGLIAAVPDQVIINEYFPGQGIAPHVDCEPCFGETILSLSLGSSCVMDLSHLHDGRSLTILLEPRSLLILGGEARYEWKHGIAPRKEDTFEGRKLRRGRRVSLTFRQVVLEAK